MAVDVARGSPFEMYIPPSSRSIVDQGLKTPEETSLFAL